MLVCPKCQTPNQDTATSCVACGNGLAGQQFAAALDRATQPPGAEAPPATAAPPPAAAPSAAAAPPAAPVVAAPADDPFSPEPAYVEPTMPMMGDVASAQAQINEFMAEQRSRKRSKTIMWVVVLLVLAGAAAFFLVRSAQKKAKRKRVAQYYLDFRKVDDQTIADFWRCTVRAKHLDVRLAKDNLVLTEGLTKAFANFPKSQPERLDKKCLPMLDIAAKQLREVKAPEGFAAPTEAVAKMMGTIKTTFGSYISKLEKRAVQTANERDLMKASAAFHTGDEAQVAGAVGYVAVLDCAIPDLKKKMKKATKPPNSQPVVEYIYNTCKDDPKYADKLRKECVTKLKDVEKDPKKTPLYTFVAGKMAGDDRDRMALAHCFKTANRGYFDADINAIGKVWVAYREVRKKLMDEVFKYKEKTD